MKKIRKKIIAGIAIYGAVFGVMWKFFIDPLGKVFQREDEWMERQNRKRKQQTVPTTDK